MTNKELTQTRESLSLTKTAFALLLGITPMLLGRYESGSCKIPEKIAEVVRKLLSSSDTSSSNTSADEPVAKQQPTADEDEPVSEDEGEPIIDEDLYDEEEDEAEDEEDFVDDLATFIKSVRTALNLTQSAFAKLLGVAASTVGMYETGRTKPREEIIIKIKELAVSTKPSSNEVADEADDAEEAKEPINGVDEADVASLIKSIRSTLDLSRAAFGKLVGVSVSSVGLYETGKGKPREGVLEKIREVAKEALLRGDDEEAAPAVDEEAVTEADEEEAEAVQAVDEEEAAASADGEEAEAATPADEEDSVMSDNKETKPAVMYIQSVMGSIITTEEVLERLPEGVETVYVKPEDNKAYWVKGEESGSVDLW